MSPTEQGGKEAQDEYAQVKFLPGLAIMLLLTYLLIWGTTSWWLSHEYVRAIFVSGPFTLMFLGGSAYGVAEAWQRIHPVLRAGTVLVVVAWGAGTVRLLARQFGLDEVARVENISVRLSEATPAPGSTVRGEVLVKCRLRCEITSIHFRAAAWVRDTVLMEGTGIPTKWVGTADEHNVARQRFTLHVPELRESGDGLLVVHYSEAEFGEHGLRAASRESAPIRLYSSVRR